MRYRYPCVIAPTYFFVHVASNHARDSPGRANGRRSKFRRCSAEAAAAVPCTSPAIYPAGPMTGRSPFSRNETSGRNYARSTTLSKTLRVSSPSRAIKHSSVAQLLLPRTWSERGTANLLESEISEVLLVAGSRAFSSRFQCRSWCTISIRAARFIFFAKICKAGLTHLDFIHSKKNPSISLV